METASAFSLPIPRLFTVKNGIDEQQPFHRITELLVNLGDEGFRVFIASFEASSQVVEQSLCVPTDGLALPKSAHGDLVDGCAQSVVIRMTHADCATGLILGE